ncbi:MAG: thioredoxin reductase [Marmoricola sp.]|jgi:thioredoxin reductase|nr:thioredoxin reductase [Marmoricola sp.]
MGEHDVVVIGGGAAGLSAALVLSSARRGVAVVDAGNPRNAPAAHMHGYLSRDGLPPRDLLEAGRAEIVAYGGQLPTGTVSAVSGTTESGFEVLLEDGLSARRLLVATGLRDELPEVAGLWARWGRDVLHCPYCHGYEVRDQRLGVLGGSAESVAHALLIAQSTDVVYFAHTTDLSDEQNEQLVARGVGVVEGTVARVVAEDDELCGLEMADGRVVERAAMFVRPRFVPNSHLAVGLGCVVDADGWVTADNVGSTSVAGVWVAGNAANPRAQVITAAGEGSAAAIALNAELVDEDVAQQVRRHRLGVAVAGRA